MHWAWITTSRTSSIRTGTEVRTRAVASQTRNKGNYMTEASRNGAPSQLVAWGGISRTADLGGAIHYVDFGGAAAAPRVVLVHGLSGSHLNWCLLAPRLAANARVLAVDLVGFGLTHPDGRAATVQTGAVLLDRFVREVAGAPAILVGNSMGGMVSIMEAVANPDAVAGLVLIDPVLPLVRGVRPDRLVATTFLLYAVPGIGERYLARRRAAVAPRELVRQVLDLCCVDPSRVPQELVAASVALAEERVAVPGLDAAFLSAARSLLRVSARRERYSAAMRAIRSPVLLLHGEKDRLVPIHSAREAAARNPDWCFEVLSDVGHVPQLEVPDAVADLILDWLHAEGATAARRAAEPAAGSRPGNGPTGVPEGPGGTPAP
jgi:pimeloyl-ACP methyl ester carboxylesterase